MYRNHSNLDGVAVAFFLAGAFILISNGIESKNLGWLLLIIGIVRQIIEWK